MNGKVRAVAYTYIALCGAALAVGLFICIGLLFSRDPSSTRALLTIGTPFVLLSGIYFIPGLAGGFGLLRGKSWAPTLLIVLSALVLFLIPVGTVLGGYAIWVLHHRTTPPSATSPGDRLPAPRRPSVPPLSPEQKSRYLGLLLAMAAVGSAFVVAIGTGFRLTRQPAPSEIDALYYPAIAVLIAVIAYAVRAWLRSRDPVWPRRARWSGVDHRVTEPAVDPVMPPYVERIKRGESWSDAQIDYNENPNRGATCVHLQPIEHEMRMMGIAVRLTTGTTVQANCCVDPVALADRFTLVPSVRYAEIPMSDRSIVDPPVALIACDACGSTIDVEQPLRARPGTPWFPAGARDEIPTTTARGAEPS